MMCSHMGAATPGFTEVAIRFHKTADKIGDAARRKDKKGVMTALDATLKECVGCHAVYRQKVVDEATWKKLTGTAAPAMHHH
jgi:cytochrome c'